MLHSCHPTQAFQQSSPYCFVLPPVSCKIFNQGAVVTDVAQCTSLGFDILGKQGSSVDAAITAALCLGIVHPHTSGIGGYVKEILMNRTNNEVLGQSKTLFSHWIFF